MENEPKKKRRVRPTGRRIVREMADIAFSEEEKTADRLRALDLLSELTAETERRESALKKLDEVLSRLETPPREDDFRK